MRNLVAALGLASLGLAMPGFSANAESIMKMCGDQWKAAKAAGATNGETWPQFLAQCRAHQQSSVVATAPADATAPAPAPTMHTVPAPPPTPVPAEPPYSSLPTPMDNGEFASDQQARAHCPTDTVVWVNTRSRVYHFAGTHNYGHTKEGAYMCEAEARAAGDKAAMNEHHP
jgi:hypothetical protein